MSLTLSYALYLKQHSVLLDIILKCVIIVNVPVMGFGDPLGAGG
jgi:hypothetical protein